MRPAMLAVASALVVALGVALVVTPPLRAQAEETHAGNVESPQAARAALASFDKAVKAFNGKDYEKARKELGICLSHQPNNSDAHLLLAKTLYAVKDYAAALTEVELAKSTFDAGQAQAQVREESRRTELQRRRRAQDEQIREINMSLSRPVSDEERRLLMASLSQAEQARDELDRQIFQPPTIPGGVPAEYHFFHGNVLLRLQRVDDAVAQYREALKIKPNYPDAANNLAALYFAAKVPKLALEVIEQAEAQGVKVNPELKKAVLEAVKP